ADTSVSGDCTGGTGDITATEDDCDSSDGSCSIDTTDYNWGVTRLDDGDTTTSVDVTPNGPHDINDGDTILFSCAVNWNEGTCTDDCLPWTSDESGCGTYDSSTGLYTGENGDCTDVVSGNTKGMSDGETINVTAETTGDPPVISSVFPLDFAARYQGNAHAEDQPLTVVFDDAAGDAPTGMDGTSCVSASDASKVNFTCDLSTYPDVVCTPDSADIPYHTRDTYNCSVDATNSAGSDSSSGSMVTSILESDLTGGGFGGGYIGGGTYDSAAGKPVHTTVDIYAVERESGDTIGGNVFVQIIQGGTLREYFTDATGHLNIELDTMPIDEITMGYKCGSTTCDETSKAAKADWYGYITYTDVDAKDAYVQMRHMSPLGRHHTTVSGTMPHGEFEDHIDSHPASGDMDRARQIFTPPVHLRGVIVISTLKDIYAVTNLDALLQVSDSESSISLCMDPADTLRYSTTFALYPNLLAPDILRNQWWDPCDTNDLGQHDFEYKIWQPESYNVLWSVGAYANATNFSLTGALNLLDFPIYVTALGMDEVDLSSWDGTSENSVDMGDLDFDYDLREDWTEDQLGYVGDSYDTRTDISASPVFPLDPARRDARLGDDSGRYTGYKVANESDSELGGSSQKDHRFTRNNMITVSGADYGDPFGLGVTGLSFAPVIDDQDWTVFKLAYTQSTGNLMGKGDIMPWSGGGDTEVPGIEHGFPASSLGSVSGISNGTSTFDFTARTEGGPANYSVIGVVSRGAWTQAAMSDPSLFGAGSVPTNSGSIISVYSTASGEGSDPGDPETTSAVKIDDFMNMPEPVSPARDDYLYPAPQWANTLQESAAINRNSELWPDETTDSGNELAKDTDDPWSRYYFEFTNPGMMIDTDKAIHVWQAGVSDGTKFTFDGSTVTTVLGKHSTKSPVQDKSMGDSGDADRSGHAYETGGNMVFVDDLYPRNGRFDNWGVRPGDSLDLYEQGARCYISAVNRGDMTEGSPRDQLVIDPSQSSSCGTSSWSDIFGGTNVSNVDYSVIRQANPEGECGIDDYNYGGATGYGCSGNSFWDVFGPVTGTGNIVAHVPDITPTTSYTDPDGTTGAVPSFWEGSTTHLASPAVDGAQLKWSYELFVYNTDSWTNGGLDHAFDYNNQNIHTTELTSQFVATDSAYFFIY
ncbi:MAG: hypothetical protein R6V10_17035, partial [bacterium]